MFTKARNQAAAILAIALCAGCTCKDRILEAVAAPNGVYTVEALNRNCGATSPHLTVVRLRGPRHFFLLSTEHEILKERTTAQYKLSWRDNTHLEITTPLTTTQAIDTQVGDVIVTIRPRAPRDPAPTP